MYWGSPLGLASKESVHNVEDLGSIPGSGRPPGGGHGNPLQYSCLENPMDIGGWRATVHGAAKSQTCLRNQHFHTFTFVQTASPLRILSEYPLRCVMTESKGMRPKVCGLSEGAASMQPSLEKICDIQRQLPWPWRCRPGRVLELAGTLEMTPSHTLFLIFQLAN